MLNNISEILEAFIEVENRKYEESFDYNHMPTLGALYESLTGEVVNRVLPSGLDLCMASGFIYDDKDFRSGEIDQMLVRGSGRPLGYTGKHEYHIKDVLVVFEVKKTLKKTDLIDAYGHLYEIGRAFSKYFEDYLVSGGEVDVSYAAKSFAQITGKEEPTRYSDMHHMPEEEGMIYYLLIQEAQAPISIIHGYGGYKTENGLRTVFLDFLEDKNKQSGFGVPSFPNLITSEKFSLVKTTGMPFKHHLTKDEYWPVLGSSRDNVVKMMMEVIWTKISQYCGIAMLWGEDQDRDVMVALLSAKFMREDDFGGWMYRCTELTENDLSKIVRVEEWEPFMARGSMRDFAMTIGLMGGAMDSASEEFLSIAGGTEEKRSELINKCIDSHLFAIGDDNYISFIGQSLHLQEIDNETYAISDDASRLNSWCERKDIQPSFINYLNAEKIFGI